MNDTANQLLDAVGSVIDEHGSSGVTLRRVGAIAGLSHTAAAHYFNDKPGLFTAYITRAWNLVAAELETAASCDDAREALLLAATSYSEFAVTHRAEFSVMSRLELARIEDQSLWQARERGFFALTAIVGRYQETGWAASRDPLDVMATLWGLVHGVTDLWVGGPLAAPYDGADLPDVIRRLVGSVIDALDPH